VDSMSRTAAYCDSVIEAALLAAIIVPPLFFNKYAGNAFEPEKIFIIRSLGLAILTAWVVGAVARGSVKANLPDLQSLGRLPLFLPIAAWVAVNILSTVFSIEPRMSFWGTFIRRMGAYTLLSCIVLFVAVHSRMRSQDRIDRLITSIIAVSVPISLYGIRSLKV
jgi:hypothetical protein